MFSKKSKAERVAADAWDYLSSALESASDAGSHAFDVTSATATKLADRVGPRVADVKDEAWTRAVRASDALSGKRPGVPWGLVVGAALVGAAIGWVAATSARAALEKQAEQEELELADQAVVVTPKYDS